MEFSESERVRALKAELQDFMERHVYPAEPVYEAQRAAAEDPHRLPPVVEELKVEARRRGLWNLFLPDRRVGAGGTNLADAPVGGVRGRSPALASAGRH